MSYRKVMNVLPPSLDFLAIVWYNTITLPWPGRRMAKTNRLGGGKEGGKMRGTGVANSEVRALLQVEEKIVEAYEVGVLALVAPETYRAITGRSPLDAFLDEEYDHDYDYNEELVGELVAV